jgi:hypothetical protein
MNNGVSKTPIGVMSFPRRAPDCLQVCMSSKEIAM